MLYCQFQDLKLSRLGFGTMRFPLLPDGTIDEPEAIRLVQHAFAQGINYFDTAYSYLGGQAEIVLGRALQPLPREKVYLASKFPGHELRDSYDPATIFERQLQKCGVEYFDFYLLHNVYESSVHTYYDERWGILDYFLAQKKAGRIRHLGFSAHAQPDLLEEFLDRMGDQMEFCQIQLNYLDWTLQNAKTKYEMLTQRQIPVWVMEPLRGGKLAELKPEAVSRLQALRPEETAAAWGFRWLQQLPNVYVTLSGMSTMAQLEDNLKTYAVEKPLSAEEMALLQELAGQMVDMQPCTGCRYCCNACSQKLDIPRLLSLYDDCRYAQSITAVMAADALPPEQHPSACIGCGNCEKVCPQGIPIPKLLNHYQEMLAEMPRWADISLERSKQDEF